jgi:hypothetical protein
MRSRICYTMGVGYFLSGKGYLGFVSRWAVRLATGVALGSMHRNTYIACRGVLGWGLHWSGLLVLLREIR